MKYRTTTAVLAAGAAGTAVMAAMCALDVAGLLAHLATGRREDAHG